MPEIVYRLDHNVAVVTFSNPPVNGLSHALRMGIADALARAQSDGSARGIVLTGADGLFSGGADIREFGTPASTAEPTLRRLIELVETSVKPVVASITGTCLGGGLELAMAAHHRVVSADAKLGLPEVKLGLLPGAGGTQRLPRLVGVARAIEMIVGGEPVRAADLVGTRLVDRVVAGDPLPEAVELAATAEAPHPRARDLPLVEPRLAVLCEEARAKLRGQRPVLPAPLRAVEAIEAAAGPFDEGLMIERRAFVELMETPESKGLRHAFFAERAAGKVEGVTAATPVRPLEEAAVIGAGTMGAGITVALLDAGIPVRLLEADQAALDRGLARIAGIYEAQVKKGRMTAEERDRRLALLHPTLSYDDIGRADLVIEAVFESLEVKRDVFLDARPGDEAGRHPRHQHLDARRGRDRRLHPAPGRRARPPLLQSGERDAAARGRPRARDLARRAGRRARAGQAAAQGGRGLGRLRRLHRQPHARRLHQAGLVAGRGRRDVRSRWTGRIEAFGFAMGPFRVGDLVGHDVSQAIRQHRRSSDPDYRASTLPDKLCALGRLGQKTGGGWYDYPEGPRRAVPSPVAAQLVEAHRAEIGVVSRPVDDAEIVDRLVYALVNEGARILDEGIAARSSDIDVVYLTGYGFPRARGGPMFYADQIGLDRVLRRVKEFARNPHGDPGFWTPAPLLTRLAETGGRLDHARRA